jgi:hypothetical protein
MQVFKNSSKGRQKILPCIVRRDPQEEIILERIGALISGGYSYLQFSNTFNLRLPLLYELKFPFQTFESRGPPVIRL